MNDAALAILDRLRGDYEWYARRHLFIVDKVSRARRAFSFNPAQKILHAKIEAQRLRNGWVRVICVKARQQGVSTYITGRGYWRATMNRNTNVFVMTHEIPATRNLFGMVQDYHRFCPPEMRPKATTDSATALAFGAQGSSYKLATAKNRGAGRSANIQYLHGSEAAFWPAIDDNLSGLGQAIALAPGTEAYLESTANGHNAFHALVQRSLKGETDYEVVFIPWFVTPEYQRKPGPGFEMVETDYEYADAYGLSLAQMAWRAHKISTDFGGDPTLFDQEYPASLVRAFRRSSTDDPFIRLQTIEAARARDNRPSGPKRLGIDPSQGSKKNDRFAFIERDDTGVRWKYRLNLSTDDTMEAANACARIIDERDPDIVFIDRLGHGAGICDRLSEIMPSRRIVGVKASEAATDTETYANKRVEMWGEMRDWLIGGASMLSDDELEADLNGPGFKFKGEAYLLESKESMDRRDLPSPDFGDAFAHTFYLPFEVARRIDRESARSGGSRSWRVQ